MRIILSFALCAGLLGATAFLTFAQDTTKPNLSAREVFYSAEESATPTPAKTTVGAPSAHTHITVKPGKKPLTATGSANNQTASAAAGTTDSSQVQAASSASPDNSVHTTVGTNAGASTPVSYNTTRKYPPLGLRYSIIQVSDSGRKQPIDADTAFHSNDHIEIDVEVNAPGYLYVVTRGSSGRWSTLFPASESDASAAMVEPHHAYTIPPGQVITFAEPSGKERLFLFLSRQPIHSSEDLMLQLSNNGNTPAPAASQPQKFPQYDAVEAFNRMDDAQISQLRTTYSRDLIVEKMHGDEAPSAAVPDAPAKDTSVYVVDPSGRADAHVVADITLNHE